jgi:hypothetical protein
MESENKPWDVRGIQISLGGEDDEIGFLEAELFDDRFRISFRNANLTGCPRGVDSVTLEEMDIDVAKRLRDFLNYAVSEK